MRTFSIAAALFLGVAMLAQADTFVYVSTGPDQKIQIYRQNAQDGALTSVASVETEAAPGSLVVDPRQKFLLAAMRNKPVVSSYQLDASTGKLTLLGTTPIPENATSAFVNIDRTGRWLLSASYGAGRVVVQRLADDGRIESSGSQVIETAKTAHSVMVDRANHLVFVPHVAPNAVYQFTLDAAKGKLTDAGKAPGGAPAAGPRHLAFHPTLGYAYTSDESGSSITAYRLDATSGLTPLQTLSTLPSDFKERNSTADVKVHPSGKFVWVSNRGHDSLAGFAIAADGKLTAIDRAPTEKTPRSFDIAPNGRFVFGAGEGSGKLAVFQVNEASGTLKRIHTYEVGKSLTWVMAIELGSR